MANGNGQRQGAVGRDCCGASCSLRGQGATEYLVIFGIVLIVALVVAALLNFYPGAAADSQITESQLYWRSARPLAVSDVAPVYNTSTLSFVSMVIKNTGDYPITLVGVFGDNASGASVNTTTYYDASMSSRPLTEITIMPGKSACFGAPGRACGNRMLRFTSASAASSVGAGAACAANRSAVLQSRDFGFDYTESIGGAVVRKRESGADLIARCVG